MKTLDKRKMLVDEAITLIREFEGISLDIRETRIEELKIDDEYTKISYEAEGMQFTFPLTQISHIYQSDFDGFAGLEPTFPERVMDIKGDISQQFTAMTKDDFIHYVGNIYYANLRCREIYARLKDIDLEAKNI